MQVFDWHFNQVFYEYLSEFFSDLKIPILWIEKVLDLFLVNLVKWDVNFPIQKRTFLSLCHLLFKEAENEIKRRWNNALWIETNLVQYSHWVGFPRPRLPIHEVTSMVAIQNMKD